MSFLEQPNRVGSGSSRLASVVDTLGGLFLASIVSLYLGLIGLGQWQGDEYDDFWKLAQYGWRAVAARLRWSPRPLSEFFFFSYGWTVNRLHQPLIIPFLGLLWAGFLVAGLLTFWQSRRVGRAGTAWPGLLVGLSLMACFLTGGHLMEVFYWPAGAAAYLPTLSATLLLFLQVAKGNLELPSGRRLCSLCLLVAACSSEAGATFVIAYALVHVTLISIYAIRRKGGSTRGPIGWWLYPAAVSLLLLIWLQLNRIQTPERPVSSLAGPMITPINSLLFAVRELTSEALGLTMHSRSWFGIGPRLPAMVLLALGVGLCWRHFGPLPKPVCRQIVEVAAALLVGSIVTICCG